MNEQALKERIKHIAKAEEKSFQEIWKLLLLERFLAKLSLSNYSEKFIFKGGLLLSYYLFIARETTDIDFLARKLQAEIPQLEAVLIEICAINVNDGFVMSLQQIEPLDHNHMNYPGYRAKLNIRFGTMKDRIQIDIGIGDTVNPKKIAWESYQYKGQSIFEESISLQAYPPETIFSEKLETITSRGATNSRIKDFHDILLLCRNRNIINDNKVKNSIITTFKNRNTDITIPLTFTDDELAQLQAHWNRHLRALTATAKEKLNLPDSLSDVMNEINNYLTTLAI